MTGYEILDLVRNRPGISDRQITDHILGLGKPQQPVNGLCRNLAKNGALIRRARPDGIIGNYASKESSTKIITTNKALKSPQYAISLEMREKARELGQLWAASTARPRIDPDIIAHWNELINDWANDGELPLLIRKQGNGRGERRVLQNGREVIQTDNSPAQWAFCCAKAGNTPSIDDIKQMMKESRIPVSFVKLQSCGITLNPEGWKLCHIRRVGLGVRKPIEELPIEQLTERFCWLMNPKNHFLVPKIWSGMGELQEVIDAVCEFDSSTGSTSNEQ